MTKLNWLAQYVCYIAVSFLAGCASVPPQKLNDLDRKNIDQVTINSQVKKPTGMYYMGPGGAFGLMFGAIGGAISGAAAADSAAILSAYSEKNGIRIENIVLQEVSAALRQSGKLTIADVPDAKMPRINITVTQYGFSIPHGFSSEVVPLVGIRCDMVDADGRVLWSQTDRVSPLSNPVDSFPPATMNTNPRVIEDTWRAASKFVANKIVKEL